MFRGEKPWMPSSCFLMLPGFERLVRVFDARIDLSTHGKLARWLFYRHRQSPGAKRETLSSLHRMSTSATGGIHVLTSHFGVFFHGYRTPPRSPWNNDVNGWHNTRHQNEQPHAHKFLGSSSADHLHS